VRIGERPVRVAPTDPYSFSNPDEIVVKHVSLDLTVDFEARIIEGSATLDLNNLTGGDTLILDTHGLSILRVELDDGTTPDHDFPEGDPIRGSALRILVRPDTRWIRIDYRTGPSAEALNWMTPEQAQLDVPYLYSQNETIGARSWIPVQDSPSVRMTWDATIHVPPGHLALMSADHNPQAKSVDGTYVFKSGIPIPAYLQSLAVSDLEFRAIDGRTGVYAAPQRIDAAHAELQVVPAMMEAAESICGPYQWGRYDVLIMPPSYHIGGMEHPRLTFATPSFISGDGSLVKLIAHELSHSWSGDQVTTATWNDPWINEGLTTYLEQRVMEAVFGAEYADMLRENSLRAVEQYVNGDPDNADTRMHADFRGRHPDVGFTRIPYDKGAAFWRTLESAVGRERLDTFLKTYFIRYAFDWMDADALVGFIEDQLLAGDSGLADDVRLDEWVFATGLPSNRAPVDSVRFRRVDAQRSRFTSGTAPASLDTNGWSPHEYIYFLQFTTPQSMSGRMDDLTAAWGLDTTQNLSLLATWSYWVSRTGYLPSFFAMERYVRTVTGGGGPVGVYARLKNNNNAPRATSLYRTYRPLYHPLTQAAIDQLLEFNGKREPMSGMEMPYKY